MDELFTAVNAMVLMGVRSLYLDARKLYPGAPDAAGFAAEELLASTDMKIASIAAEVGCSSPQHFSALFRRARGRSPQEFRSREAP